MKKTLFLLALFLLPAIAFAQGAAVPMPPPPGPPPPPSFADALARMTPMFLVVLVVFHFFLIRPQNKKEQDHAKLIKELKAGDSVVTTGGLIGKVVGPIGEVVTLEISQGVKVRFLPGNIVKKEGA